MNYEDSKSKKGQTFLTASYIFDDVIETYFYKIRCIFSSHAIAFARLTIVEAKRNFLAFFIQVGLMGEQGGYFFFSRHSVKISFELEMT